MLFLGFIGVLGVLGVVMDEDNEDLGVLGVVMDEDNEDNEIRDFFGVDSLVCCFMLLGVAEPPAIIEELILILAPLIVLFV